MNKKIMQLRSGSIALLSFIDFLIICTLSCQTNHEPRVVMSFDEHWLFYREDVLGGERISLQDSGWQRIDVPHDWSIEDLPGMTSPFDSTVVNGVHNGFTRGGTGWYRKHFHIDKKDAGRRVIIQFDGVYMNSDIWINEQHVGNHFYGYSGFQFDITDFIKFGEDNLVAVRVENETVRCRWYSGAALLDACERLGIVVIDEAFDLWRYGYFDDDYATFFDRLWRGDLENMIVRDRNHPSVIMWSIGNEIIKARTGNDTIAALCGEMSRFVKSIDDTRPVTSTDCYVLDKHDSYFSHLDVCGYRKRQ